LSEDGISARAKEGLDLQVLFDPFEEKLDLPTLMIDVANRLSDKVADICKENLVLPSLRVPVPILRRGMGQSLALAPVRRITWSDVSPLEWSTS
jgi:hypothetical protein